MRDNQEREMSLVGHLTELRGRIIICLLAVIVGVVGSLFVAKPLVRFLTLPVHELKQEPGRAGDLTLIVGADGTLKLNDPEKTRANLSQLSQKRFRLLWPEDPERKIPPTSFLIGENSSQRLFYNSPIDPIIVPLKVALILGILFALPVCLWQIWLFVGPGLTEMERKVVRPLLAGAVVLFPLGAAFAFYVIRFVLAVMQVYAVQGVDPLINIYSYLSLLSNLMLTFGIIFEVPLVLAIAARIGLVEPKFLQTYRRHAYIVLAFGAMVITPGGDPITMIAVLLPLFLLYELAIALSKPMARLHAKDLEQRTARESAQESEV